MVQTLARPAIPDSEFQAAKGFHSRGRTVEDEACAQKKTKDRNRAVNHPRLTTWTGHDWPLLVFHRLGRAFGGLSMLQLAVPDAHVAIPPA